MKTLVPELEEHLNGEALTLAYCWLLTRRDGVEFGFTDHDYAIEFEGKVFDPTDGIDATKIVQSLGMAVDNLELAGAIQDDRLTHADLAAGLYDGATVKLWLVNWSDHNARTLLATGSIGEVVQAEGEFAAEFRSQAARLMQSTGRTFSGTCNASLGDGRCKVNLANWRESSTISQTGRSAVKLASLDLDRKALAGGTFRVTAGPYAGFLTQIKSASSGRVVTFWEPIPYLFDEGTEVEVVSGCDKTWETCQERFSNATNFRGFPHIPGNDRMTTYPNSKDERLDGGSLFR